MAERADLIAVRAVLRDALDLGARADNFSPETPLLGALPELDSMAILTVVQQLEESFGVQLHDDDITAENFATLGTLIALVEQRANA